MNEILVVSSTVNISHSDQIPVCSPLLNNSLTDWTAEEGAWVCVCMSRFMCVCVCLYQTEEEKAKRDMQDMLNEAGKTTREQLDSKWSEWGGRLVGSEGKVKGRMKEKEGAFRN